MAPCIVSTRVAAPPAGSLMLPVQVQIYDLAGFKLSYVMGDMFTLFKVRSTNTTCLGVARPTTTLLSLAFVLALSHLMS